MILNEKIVNYKVEDIYEMYIFCFSNFSIEIFEFENIRTSYRISGN